MRIAVLSDIHGNLLALDAVMTDIEAQSPDQIWCGGDLAWGGPWASDCIARVRAAGWPTVRGNTDVWVTGDPQTIEGDADRKEMQAVAAAHDISDDDAAWLVSLPVGHTGEGSILLVHGTPESPFEAPMPDASAADFSPYQGEAAIVVYGHVHRAFVRRLSDGTIVCNPGSVGFPEDAETASYMLIDLEGPEWVLRIRRVAFDRRGSIAQARALGGPVERVFLSHMGLDP
ncbi:MAG TPA: metallophosphoesterase family protein [Actinomycetota bacterium]|jgi:putative phosphoesterase|nr:metallophosphoesterase family protein [Actinomycetota bacterium]